MKTTQLLVCAIFVLLLLNGTFQIFKLDVNSGVRTQLTHIVGRNFGGDWFDPAYALPVSPQPKLLTTTWGEMKKK